MLNSHSFIKFYKKENTHFLIFALNAYLELSFI